jgi:hypothetical protein
MRRFFPSTILLTLLFLGSMTFSQGLDWENKLIQFSRKSLATVQFLEEIENQTGFSFVFTSNIISPEEKLRLSTRKIKLKAALEALSAQTTLGYTIIGQQIVLRAKTPTTSQPRLQKVNRIQGQYTIRGYVRNANNGEVLINAQVYDAISGQGVLTNNYGFYSLSLKPGPVQLIAAEASYKKRFASFHLGSDTSIIFQLPLFALQEVQIIAEEARQIQEETQMSSARIPVEQIKQMPALLGEVDVVKVVQMLPGVQSGLEGSSGLYVRGGGPDQNLILLDDVPLYTIGHLGGLFSVFNADAISTVQLTKGGFPARYGGRLSSILDIRMKDGNSEKLEADASLGLISGKLSLNGPIGKKTTFLLSGRRTWLDLPVRLLVKLTTRGRSSIGYQFNDVNAKLVHRFSNKDKIYLSLYSGEDAISTGEKAGLILTNNDSLFRKLEAGQRWGNRMAALRWNHIWSPKLFSNVTATYTQFKFLTGSKLWQGPTEEYDFFEEFRFFSGIRDFGLKSDFEWYISPFHTVRFGSSITRHRFAPGRLAIASQTNGNAGNRPFPFNPEDVYDAWESGLYVEDEIRFGPRISVNLGLHLAWYNTQGKDHISPQVRVAGRYQAWDNIALKASFVQMTQYLHLLSSAGAGIPIDVWVPATPLVPQQESDQFAAGFAASLWQNQFELSVEAYYKQMQGLIEYKSGTGFLTDVRFSTIWEQQVETGGAGWAYGTEFFLQKKTGKIKGWIGYTLSWNNRKFENLNNGLRYPYRYDRRHDIALAVTWDVNKRIQVGGNWVFGTGNAVSFPTARAGAAGEPVQGLELFRSFFAGSTGGYGIYDGGRNASRAEDYHRLDASISFIKQKKKGRERKWIVSIYNAYSRRNPFSYYTGRVSVGEAERVEVRKIALFPIIPMLTFTHSY